MGLENMSDESIDGVDGGDSPQKSANVAFDEKRIQHLVEENEEQHQHHHSTHSSPLPRTLSAFRGRGGQHRRRGIGTSSASDTSSGDALDQHDDRMEFVSTGSVEIPMTLSLNNDNDNDDEDKNNKTISVDSTNVALSWKVPPKRGARWSASFASQSVSRKKLGYLTCTSRVGYDVLPSTRLYTEMDFGAHPRACMGTIMRLSRTSDIQVGLGTVPFTSNAMALSVEGRRNFLKNRLGGTVRLAVDTRRRFHVLRLGLTTLVDRIPTISLNVNLGVNATPLEVAIENQRGIASVGMGLGGNMIVYGMVRRNLSNFAAIGVGVRAAAGRGLSWLFQLERGDFVMKIPVTICTRLDGGSAVAMMYLTFLSGLIDGIVGDFIAKALAASEGDDKDSTNGSGTMRRTASLLRLDKNRDDAQKQISLMERQATSKRKREEARDGLVIEQAIYYVEGTGGSRLDVSTALQFWVADSSLYLPGISKSHLLGFHDIRKKQTKKQDAVSFSSWDSVWKGFWSEPDVAMPILYVRYKLEGEVFEISVRDDDELVLPCPSAVRVKLSEDAK